MNKLKDHPRVEIVPVYGTRDEINAIIQDLSGVEIVDWGTDLNKDFVVALKMPTDEVEFILPKISTGVHDLGSPSNGIETSFKPRMFRERG